MHSPIDKDTIAFLTFLALIVGGAWALYLFRKQTLVKRADWIASLHEKFYQNSTYSAVRLKIDQGVNIFKAETKHDDSLTVYLNFFQYVGALVELGQLSISEVDMIFGWEINALMKHEADAAKYLNENAYDRVLDIGEPILKMWQEAAEKKAKKKAQ